MINTTKKLTQTIPAKYAIAHNYQWFMNHADTSNLALDLVKRFAKNVYHMDDIRHKPYSDMVYYADRFRFDNDELLSRLAPQYQYDEALHINTDVRANLVIDGGTLQSIVSQYLQNGIHASWFQNVDRDKLVRLLSHLDKLHNISVLRLDEARYNFNTLKPATHADLMNDLDELENAYQYMGFIIRR